MELTHDKLIELGFQFEQFKIPSQTCGIDLYYGYDAYFKKIGNKTDLVLRKKTEILKVEGFYSSNIKTVDDLNKLIQLLS